MRMLTEATIKTFWETLARKEIVNIFSGGLCGSVDLEDIYWLLVDEKLCF